MSTAFYVRSGDEDFLATFDDGDLEDMYEDMFDYVKEQGFTSIDYMLATSTTLLDADLDEVCNRLKISVFKWED